MIDLCVMTAHAHVPGRPEYENAEGGTFHVLFSASARVEPLKKTGVKKNQERSIWFSDTCSANSAVKLEH